MTIYDSTVKCSAQLPSTPLTRQEHRPVPAERHSSGLDSNSCCCVISIEIQLKNPIR